MDADGVPHAGLWLNDTVNGTEGTFLPLSTPAVSNNRLYFLSLFKPQGAQYTYPNALLRLYAIDVHTTISNRLEVAWKYDLILKNAYIPGPGNYHNAERVLLPLSSIIVQNNTVVASVNVVQYSAGWMVAPDPVMLNGSTIISVTDGGSTEYAVNYAENLVSDAHLPVVVQTLNYCGVWPGHPPPKGSFICQDGFYIIRLSIPPTYKGDSYVYNTTSWTAAGTAGPHSAASVGKDPGLTGQTTAVQVTSTAYTSYGIVQGLEYVLYGFNVTSELFVLDLLWTLHLPVLPTGQLVTMDSDGKTLLFVTMEMGVASYVIGSA